MPDGSAVIVVGPREKIPVDRPTDAADLMSATRARRFESLREAKAVLSPEISGRKMKTVYVLRVRPDDESHWSEPEYYRTRKERDRVAAQNRAFGGIRTHSYEEKKTPEEIAQLFDGLE